MQDEQIQINAQTRLQEFDDAREKPDSDIVGLGKKAVDALDTFITYWNNKPYMQPNNVDLADGGHVELKEYAQRQIEWATYERERVLNLLPKTSDA